VSSKQSALSTIKIVMRACKSCELAHTRTNVVPGHGNPDASIMFVGEAPGANEDEQGKPFVGKAGELLDRGLEFAGINRDDVFVTNAVKCRPPGNRRPYAEEISSCMHFLFNEMMAVEPQVVVLLGGTSINLFASGVCVGDYHGEIIPKYKIDVKFGRVDLRKSDLPDMLGFYHPAAQIYNRSLRETFVGDCLKLKKLVK